jgi:hypothetical protein
MKLIPDSINRGIGRKVLQTKKNSPHIFFAAGLVGVVGSTVLACRATLKLDKTLDEIRTDLHDVKELKKDTDEGFNTRKYEREYAKDLMYVYGKSAFKLGRLYGPSILVGGVGVAFLTGSHIQLTKRNNAAMVTLAGVMKAYDEYRARVAEEIGEERELELHRAINNEKVEGEDGKKHVIKVTDPTGWSPYARIFDETSQFWKNNAELNRFYLDCQQRYFNQLLHSRGHVFLNEIYDQLGFERTSYGAVLGWLRDGDGDKFIDFGMFEAASSPFINGYEKSIVLDFNVDGPIWDKI